MSRFRQRYNKPHLFSQIHLASLAVRETREICVDFSVKSIIRVVGFNFVYIVARVLYHIKIDKQVLKNETSKKNKQKIMANSWWLWTYRLTYTYCLLFLGSISIKQSGFQNDNVKLTHDFKVKSVLFKKILAKGVDPKI